MIIVYLSSQLGNMMFQYAAIKTIATAKGLDFKYIRIENKHINSSDAKYGSELNTIFSIPASEQLYEVPENYTEYREPLPHLRDYPGYPQDVYNNITDNSLVIGFFITPELIVNNLDNVRKWYTLPSSAIDKATVFLQPYKARNKKICVVHFRVGRDYFILGYKLHKSYWQRAAEEVLKRHNDVQFICIYDKRTKEVESFLNKYPGAEYHGSLVDDLAMITQADINIVCNSSFSIMGALLNPQSILAISPSIYPTPAGNLPDNTYARHWIRIPNTKRNIASQITWTLRSFIKSIIPLRFIKKLLRK